MSGIYCIELRSCEGGEGGEAVGCTSVFNEHVVKYSEFNNFLNFGWSCYEGTYEIYHKHYKDVSKSSKLCKSNINNKKLKFVEPSIQYFHDSIINADYIYGNSITGGALYKNSSSIWNNHYFFGDLVSSNIWFVDMKEKQKGHRTEIKQGNKKNIKDIKRRKRK